MKKFIFDTLKYSFGSPVIGAGQGLQAVGKGTVAVGLAVHTAGVKTEEKGRQVKGHFDDKAITAAAASQAKKAATAKKVAQAKKQALVEKAIHLQELAYAAMAAAQAANEEAGVIPHHKAVHKKVKAGDAQLAHA